MKLQKTNLPGYEKDQDTGLVINTNKDQLTSYRTQREALLDRKRLWKEIESLKKEVKDLKEYIEKYSFGVMSGHPSWWIKGHTGAASQNISQTFTIGKKE